jgi:hypothetical protein
MTANSGIDINADYRLIDYRRLLQIVEKISSYRLYSSLKKSDLSETERPINNFRMWFTSNANEANNR